MKNKLTVIGVTLGMTFSFGALAGAPNSAATAPAQASPTAMNQSAAAPKPIATVAAVTNSTAPAKTTPVTTSFTQDQVKEIQQIVHDYLIKNPDVLVEASQVLQERELAKAQQTAASTVSQNKDKLFSDANSPVVGNPKGTVSIVEFLDYQCGHCKNMSAVIDKAIKQNPNLKVIIKELPIFGATSEFAAKAALAAAKQNKFYAFHVALLSQDNPLTKQSVLALAKTVGLDVNKLKKDINDPAIAKQVRDNFQLAQSIRLMGTPAFVISNSDLSQFKYIPGATTLNDLQQQITGLSGSQPTGQAQPAAAPQQADNSQPSDQNKI